MSIWQCFGCSYRCKCEVEDSGYCIPKKCVAYELSTPNWQLIKEDKKDVQKKKAE